MKRLIPTFFTALGLFLIINTYGQAGTPDSSFGVNGQTTINFNVLEGSYAQSVAIQQDQKIVIAGFTGNKFTYGSNFAVCRLLPGGLLDSSFGINGKVTTVFNNAKSSYAICVKIQNDGKILVGGAVFVASRNRNFGIVRYNINGTIDSGF